MEAFWSQNFLKCSRSASQLSFTILLSREVLENQVENIGWSVVSRAEGGREGWSVLSALSLYRGLLIVES